MTQLTDRMETYAVSNQNETGMSLTGTLRTTGTRVEDVSCSITDETGGQAVNIYYAISEGGNVSFSVNGDQSIMPAARALFDLTLTEIDTLLSSPNA